MAKKSKKPLTDEEKFELELQQEADLQHQQRDYTLLCKDRETIEESGGSKLAKQRKVIDIYQRELANLTNDLNVAISDGKKKIDKQDAHQLVELLNEYDKFSESIRFKKAHLSEIDYQITKVDKDVAYMRSIQLTDKMWQDRTLAGQKTLEALENKLDVQIKKFCTICAQNNKLREEIDHLLKERADFNLKWDKLIKNLCIGKKFMLDLIEQATIAYDQREEWCSKLQALRTKAHSDLISHINEMRELQRKEDNDKKLAEFFSTKGQKRVMAAMEEKERAKRKDKRKRMEEKLRHYTNILADVYDFTNQNEIDEIMESFKERETENFALFKYINELNREMEELNDTLGYLHLDIDEQRVLMQVRADKQQETLQRLREDLDEATQQADAADFALVDCDKKIVQLCSGVEDLFKLCKCDRDPLLPLLGENQKVNHFNVLLFLQILERHVQDYICEVYNAEKILTAKRKIRPKHKLIRSEGALRPLYSIEQIVPANPCPLCVEHEQVSDVIDVLQRILTKEQTEVKLAARLELPDGLERIHNVSACHLPKSRQIIQKRYQ
ncbi:coiled-coil domain-containing protein 63-like [Coccinella septempunctata]|uniref:coiled-coil domain-containing protein 63-like n=1 Tax=Coccinella septempunctata TaxID=41139 RepID=UPI001D08F8BE|nr:coiled-coil domain-containing protein 63-like [Coccinella septempunctata]